MKITCYSSLVAHHYSVQSRDQISIKSYEFLSFAKNTGKDIGKNISKNLIIKYSQRILDHAKQFATYAPKTASKKSVQKTIEATDDLIGNKIADQVTIISRNSRQNSLRTVTNEAKSIWNLSQKYLKKDVHLQKNGRRLSMI